jgi:hypothetical protein
MDRLSPGFAASGPGNYQPMGLRRRSSLSAGLGRAAHDIGLGALIGGNLFARVGMHPALGELHDPRERGKVLNAAWRRYGTVNSLSLLALVAGWAGARAQQSAPGARPARDRVATAQDGALAAVVVSGVAAALQGMRFARMEPGGAIPLADGSTPAAQTPDREARAKRTLNALGNLNLASALALAAVNASRQADASRPLVRRLSGRR